MKAEMAAGRAVRLRRCAYAGQQINLQFAMRTDGSIVNPGVFIDSLQILD